MLSFDVKILLRHNTPSPASFRHLFTTFSGLLFSFRSRYYCAIGFEEYLVLEVDDPRSCEISNPHYSGLHMITDSYMYGTVTLCGQTFQNGFTSNQLSDSEPQHHISLAGFSLNSVDFDRLYSRHLV